MKRYIETNFSAKWTILAVVIAIGLAVAAQAALPSPISAAGPRPLGCQFDTDSIDPISYKFWFIGSRYTRAVRDAADEWNDTSAPGYFREQFWSLDPEVTATDRHLSGTWWAAMRYRCTSDGTFRGNEVDITFNTQTMDSLTARQKKLVAMHELGHAYGLDDTARGCYVMKQGRYKFTCGTMPTSADVSAVDALY